MVFLEITPIIEQTITNATSQRIAETLGVGMVVALLAGLILLIVLVLIGFYVYMALAWMTIARKLGYENSWLAWIPIANLFLLPILAKKHWAWGFFFLIPPVYIILAVFWLWNIYDQRGCPKELSLITLGHLFPGVSGIVFIANLVIFGLVAWRDVKKKRKK